MASLWSTSPCTTPRTLRSRIGCSRGWHDVSSSRPAAVKKAGRGSEASIAGRQSTFGRLPAAQNLRRSSETRCGRLQRGAKAAKEAGAVRGINAGEKRKRQCSPRPRCCCVEPRLHQWIWWGHRWSDAERHSRLWPLGLGNGQGLRTAQRCQARCLACRRTAPARYPECHGPKGA